MQKPTADLNAEHPQKMLDLKQQAQKEIEGAMKWGVLPACKFRVVLIKKKTRTGVLVIFYSSDIKTDDIAVAVRKLLKNIGFPFVQVLAGGNNSFNG